MFRVGRGIVRSILSQQQHHHPSSPRSGLLVQNCPYHSLFINPPPDEVPTLTTLKIMEIFQNEFGHSREYSYKGLAQTQKNRQELVKLLPQPEDELPPRKMSDSFVTAVIPLKSRPDIRERYVSAEGLVRIGRVLEDMDIFSVFCCFQHILNPRSVGKPFPYSVVTAMMDTIHIQNGVLKFNENVRISGHVTYAGTSSMEVGIIVDQRDEDEIYRKCFDAVFLLVARNPLFTGGARINPLLAETPEEEEFLKGRKERQQIRKAEEKQHIFKNRPLKEEMQLVHEGFLRKLKNPNLVQPNVKTMKDTILRTVVICQPENRNRYNKIFGGFIMRKAYELAFTNTYIYGRRRPRIVNIDNIKFQIPVAIGSIMRLKSFVGYVENDYVHTVVLCDVLDPHREVKVRSNEFNFTFLIPGPAECGAPATDVPDLEYRSYEEAMNYLVSRRHFKKMMKDFKYVFVPLPQWCSFE